jgi:hypothetical protein
MYSASRHQIQVFLATDDWRLTTSFIQNGRHFVTPLNLDNSVTRAYSAKKCSILKEPQVLTDEERL